MVCIGICSRKTGMYVYDVPYVLIPMLLLLNAKPCMHTCKMVILDLKNDN